MRRRVLGSLAGLPLALLLAVTACAEQPGGQGVASVGNASSGPSATAIPAAGLSRQERALKFVQCMREQGIDLPDPDPETGRVMMRFGPGTDRAKVEAAQEACKAYSPSGEGPGQGDPQAAENMRKFAQCMRDNGVPHFPDPEGGMVRIDKSMAEDPDFAAAQQKCGDQFLPSRGGGS